jgi:hypothetical protein
LGDPSLKVCSCIFTHKDRRIEKTMVMAGKLKRNFRPIETLLACLKGRQFHYLEEDDTREEPIIEDRVETEDEPILSPEGEKSCSGRLNPPLALYFNNQSSGRKKVHLFQRTSSLDSLPDSIESMDSLSASNCNPEDNSTSQATARVSNCHGETYLMEHLNFLSVSTQPQEVKLMYDS